MCPHVKTLFREKSSFYVLFACNLFQPSIPDGITKEAEKIRLRLTKLAERTRKATRLAMSEDTD